MQQASHRLACVEILPKESGAPPPSYCLYLLHTFSLPFHIVMVAEARGCGANLLAVWNALFLTQWAQSLSLSANSLLYISLFSPSRRPPRASFPISCFIFSLFLFLLPPVLSFAFVFPPSLLFKDALLRLPRTQLNYSNPPLLFFFFLF